MVMTTPENQAALQGKIESVAARASLIDERLTSNIVALPKASPRKLTDTAKLRNYINRSSWHTARCIDVNPKLCGKRRSSYNRSSFFEGLRKAGAVVRPVADFNRKYFIRSSIRKNISRKVAPPSFLISMRMGEDVLYQKLQAFEHLINGGSD